MAGMAVSANLPGCGRVAARLGQDHVSQRADPHSRVIDRHADAGAQDGRQPHGTLPHGDLAHAHRVIADVFLDRGTGHDGFPSSGSNSRRGTAPTPFQNP